MVVALIIMGVILVSALSISLATVRERNASISSSKSGLAYQNAETGIEKAMNEIMRGAVATVGEVRTNTAGSGYTLQFKDESGSILADSASINLIKTIRSVGEDVSDQSNRVIEAVVAAGSCNRGIYVGVTNSSYNGSNVGGYTGGDSKCNADHPGSHMCSQYEILNSTHCTNVNISSGGWYSTGIRTTYLEGATNYEQSDCKGWTKSDASYMGNSWDASGKFPAMGMCSGTAKIMCCN